MEDCVVLYVEDDDATAYLFQMAMRSSGATPQIFRVTDGDEACDFLTHVELYTEAPTPDMVVLDLNLPGRSGIDILRLIQSDSQLSRIPVYVFTTSSDAGDRALAVSLGARNYLTKGDSYDSFVDAASAVCSGLTTDESKSNAAHG
jgi:CheY-like chemotaxis protein